MAVLLVVAEPLRNAGKYTMADMLAYRHASAPGTRHGCRQHADHQHLLHDRADGRGGALVALLLKGSGSAYRIAVIGVGILMMVYVVFGGMMATTWVQIVKAVLLMAGTVVLSFMVLEHFHFSFASLFRGGFGQVMSHA